MRSTTYRSLPPAHTPAHTNPHTHELASPRCPQAQHAAPPEKVPVCVICSTFFHKTPVHPRPSVHPLQSLVDFLSDARNVPRTERRHMTTFMGPLLRRFRLTDGTLQYHEILHAQFPGANTLRTTVSYIHTYEATPHSLTKKQLLRHVAWAAWLSNAAPPWWHKKKLLHLIRTQLRRLPLSSYRLLLPPLPIPTTQ
jgi:hypothetical protein